MQRSRLIVSSSLPLLALAVIASGCGDPLVGTWTTTTFPGGTMPSDVASYEQSVTFGSDMSMHTEIVVHVSPSARVYAGCAETCAISGLHWFESGSGNALAVTITGGATKTSSRSGCASAADDQTSMPATAQDCPAGMPAGAYGYTIDGTTLAIDDGAGSRTNFVRQP